MKNLKNSFMYMMVTILILNIVCIPSKKVFAQSISSSVITEEDMLSLALLDIERLENIDCQIEEVIDLYDMNLESNYKLLILNVGYAIITRNGIVSECSCDPYIEIPYIDYLEKQDEYQLIYAGPYNYFVLKDNNCTTFSNNVDDSNFNYLTQEISSSDLSIIQANEDVLQVNENLTVMRIPEYSVAIAGDYGGIDPKVNRFDRYKDWKNTDGTCGVYAAAVMLAYFDDYISDSYIKGSVRTRNSKSSGSLITKLKACMDGGTNTLPSDVENGINSFLDSYSNFSSPSSKYSVGTIWWTGSIIEAQLDANRPCCLGLLVASGNKYGNHWVTGYYYQDNSKGRYFTAHDNWGDSKATINSLWVQSVAYMK